MRAHTHAHNSPHADSQSDIKTDLNIAVCVEIKLFSAERGGGEMCPNTDGTEGDCVVLKRYGISLLEVGTMLRQIRNGPG